MHSLTSTVSVQRLLGRNDQTAHWPPDRKSQGCVQFCKNNLDICCLCQCIFAYLYKLLQIMSQQHAKEKLKEFGKCMSWTPHKPHFKDRADSSSFSDLG